MVQAGTGNAMDPESDADSNEDATSQSAPALRVELAKKVAELQYMQGALAEATATKGLAEGVPELLGEAAQVKSELQLVKAELTELRSNTARCARTAPPLLACKRLAH